MGLLGMIRFDSILRDNFAQRLWLLLRVSWGPRYYNTVIYSHELPFNIEGSTLPFAGTKLATVRSLSVTVADLGMLMLAQA